MGTEVLRSQDYLTDRIGVPRRKPYYTGNNNNNAHRKPIVRSEHKRRNSNSNVDGARSVTTTTTTTAKVDVGRKVTILKRGESMPQIVVKNDSSLRSEEVYAGSAAFSSPSPRKLPLPTFSNKKKEGMKMIDDSATKDLRRLLRLDFD